MSTAPEDVKDAVAEMVMRAQDDPSWFYMNILGMEAQPWQLEATHAVFDVRRPAKRRKFNKKGLPRISIRSCHGPGKTHFLAMLMHIWNFTTYGLIACTAPKEMQLRKRLWPRYRKAMRHAAEWYKNRISVNNTSVVIQGDTDWGATAETASDPENLAGFHDTPQLFLIDEASAKRLDAMFPVIEGALTTPGSVSVEIGNPTRTEGEFYDHHCKKDVKDLYYLMHIKPQDSPYVSPEWVRTLAIKYGKESPVFKVRALGEFASLDDYQLIPLDFIEDMFDTEEEPDGSLPILKVTIDVADGGADSTVITVARHYETFIQVIKQRQFYFQSGSAVGDSAKAGMRMFDEFGGDKNGRDVIIVDSLGVGAGAVSMIIDEGYPVVRYIGGGESGNPKKWRNCRVQCYMVLFDYASKGKIRISPGAIDDEDDFRNDLTRIRRAKDQSADRIDDLEPKSYFRQNGLPSPDRADSLAMQFTTQSPWAASVTDSVHVVGRSTMAEYDAGLT